MRELLDSTDCVLFDFDGTLCRLFVRHRAADVAARLRSLLESQGAAPAFPEPDDPYAVLRDGLARHGSAAPELLAALTSEELRAADSAWPAPYADRLMRTLHATGRRQAIVTETSGAAVERYLAGRGLAPLFAGSVHGREGHPQPQAPGSTAVDRALAAAGTAPERALLVGGSPRALAAADAAGVRFLGYAPDEAREAALREAGAEHVTASLLEVVDAVAVPHFG